MLCFAPPDPLEKKRSKKCIYKMLEVCLNHAIIMPPWYHYFGMVHSKVTYVYLDGRIRLISL